MMVLPVCFFFLANAPQAVYNRCISIAIRQHLRQVRSNVEQIGGRHYPDSPIDITGLLNVLFLFPDKFDGLTGPYYVRFDIFCHPRFTQ
jgi:hypothetical protein